MTDTTLVETKWVRIMPDWCASGIWDINGACCDESELPVTQELRNRILAWQKRFDRQDPMEDPTPESEQEEWILSIEEMLIAIEVAKQLPDWTVVIHNCGGFWNLPRDEYDNSVITGDMRLDPTEAEHHLGCSCGEFNNA